MIKKVFFLLSIFFLLCNCDSKKHEEKKQSVMVLLTDSISDLKPERYIGKSISDFLNDKYFSRYTQFYVSSHKPSIASSLIVCYNGGIYFELIPNEFKYMDTFSELGKWDIDDFKKEKIGKINIYKDYIMLQSIK